MGRGNSICKGTEAQKDDGELEGSVFEGEGRAGVQGPRRDGKKWRKKKKKGRLAPDRSQRAMNTVFQYPSIFTFKSQGRGSKQNPDTVGFSL